MTKTSKTKSNPLFFYLTVNQFHYLFAADGNRRTSNERVTLGICYNGICSALFTFMPTKCLILFLGTRITSLVFLYVLNTDWAMYIATHVLWSINIRQYKKAWWTRGTPRSYMWTPRVYPRRHLSFIFFMFFIGTLREPGIPCHFL